MIRQPLGEAEEPCLGAGKPLVLLARLLAERRGVARDVLAAMLWPEAEEKRARASLRQALHVMRRVIGESMLNESRHSVAVSSDLTADVRTFERCFADGDDASSIALYTGPFLEDVSLSDANDADRWIEYERDRLCRLFALAVSREARRALTHGDADRAVDVATKLRTLHPKQAKHWGLLLDVLRAARRHRRLEEEYENLEALVRADAVSDVALARAILARHEASVAGRAMIAMPADSVPSATVESDAGPARSLSAAFIPLPRPSVDGVIAEPEVLMIRHGDGSLPPDDGMGLVRQLLASCQIPIPASAQKYEEAVGLALQSLSGRSLRIEVQTTLWTDGVALALIRRVLAEHDVPGVQLDVLVGSDLLPLIEAWGETMGTVTRPLALR